MTTWWTLVWGGGRDSASCKRLIVLNTLVGVFVRWCVLLALVTPWLASAQTLTATGGIQGRVSESITARPIADAEIQLLRGAVVQTSTWFPTPSTVRVGGCRDSYS